MGQKREKRIIRRPGTNGQILNRRLIILLDLATAAFIIAAVAICFTVLVVAAYNESGVTLSFNHYHEHALELTIVSLGIPLVAWRVPTWFIRATIRDIEKEDNKWT